MTRNSSWRGPFSTVAEGSINLQMIMNVMLKKSSALNMASSLDCRRCSRSVIEGCGRVSFCQKLTIVDCVVDCVICAPYLLQIRQVTFGDPNWLAVQDARDIL